MESLLKNLVLLGLIGGIVYLASNDLNGWGWLIFLFILTSSTDSSKESNNEIQE